MMNDELCGTPLADAVAFCERPPGNPPPHGACLSYVDEGQDTGDLFLEPGDCLDWVEW